MNLHEIATPESDTVFGPRVTGMRSEKCRDLERRLTVTRNALEWANAELGKCTKPNPVTEALAQTAPKP